MKRKKDSRGVERMKVLELPRRRYSVPETIMRKYRLRQRAESSHSSSSGGDNRRRRCADKSIQTSPRESIGRTSSFPFLATPSPCVWSYATSDCQTVSDRTTSTQDSTLSVPSTTPEGSLTPFRTEDVQTQVSFPDQVDKTTSVTGLERDRTEETILDIAVSIETDLSDETVIEANRRRCEKETKKTEDRVSAACQTGSLDLFKVPEINVFKDSSESQSDEKTLQMKEESSQVTTKDLPEVLDPIGYHLRKVRAEVACTGSNYEELPLENPIIPRYSAIPRTNSMVVNTSSIDYSSDSDISLTDSLEDPDEYRTSSLRKQSKHDERMVRGEVAMEQEPRRLPKSRDAYAYFLSLTGEEEIIREYSIPEWLRARLRKREQEIKKEYEDKFTRHQQCVLHRRKRKNVRRIHRVNSSSSGDKTMRNQYIYAGQQVKNENKTVHFVECTNNNNVSKNNLNPGPSKKNPTTRFVNGNNVGLEPKIDNISRNKHNNNNHNNKNNGGEQKQDFIQAEPNNRSSTNPNVVQISEVIKIEMSDNLRTVITKEKQINLGTEMNLKESGRETLRNELTNTMTSVITKNIDKNYTTETNTFQATSQAGTKEEAREAMLPSSKINQNKEEAKSSKIEKSSLVVPEIKFEETTSKAEMSTKSNIDFVASPTRTHNTKCSSKLEIERTIADILITALEENTKARQLSMRTEESVKLSEKEKSNEHSKTFVDQGSQKNGFENIDQPPKTCSLAVQTDEIVDSKEEDRENIERCNVLCNTEPYLVSIFVQTSDKDSQDEEDTGNNSESDAYEAETVISLDGVDSSGEIPLLDENIKMVDKACNTVESASISTQTSESMLQSDDIVNRLKKQKSSKKKEVQFPPQVIKQIITGTGEYKTVQHQSGGKSREGNRGRKSKVNRGTNTEDVESVTENNKNIINNNAEIISNRTASTQFCKNIFSSKSHPKKSQVLELNVPPCTCHMCTLQRISPRGDLARSKIPQSRKITEPREDRKQTQKFGTRRGNVIANKFSMFEVIPEEKNSSAESIPEGETIQENPRPLQAEKREKGVSTEQLLVDQIVQVGSNNVNAATNTEPNMVNPSTTSERSQISDQPKRKSNLVIGRFRSENRESPMLVRQYKGRASLSAGHVEEQEELLTLSKGWINFYLLKDNFDLSDSNGEEVFQPQTTGRKRIQTVEKEKDKVEEYTVEIHATPEPEQKTTGRGRVTLPEINTSSSSSTPEGERKKSRKPAVEPLPGVRKSKRTRRSQINLTREAITELGSAYRRQDQEISSTRAVEVACSEQSISSITSSTVILSESPPPQPLKLPERRSHHRHRSHRNLGHHHNHGSNWTVTVAGSSGSGNDPPPDVEMKLTFGKQGKKQEDSMIQYQMARAKRQDQMIEELTHMSKNDSQTQLQCALQTNQHPKSCLERTRVGTARDNFNYEEDYINRLSSRRSRYSTEDGSETTGDLHVTGLAITPEKKPRVPTQSERDILRPQRYKFTR